MSSLIASAAPHLSLLAPLCCALAVGAIVPVRASEGGPVGAFDQHGDIGSVGIPGSTTYDTDSQTYLLSSSGANMWNDHDAFQFAWKKVSGDFILQAFTEFWGVGADPHRKLGLMVRAGLDPRSAHVNACRHGSGLMALQYRKTEGALTQMIQLPVDGADVLQIERSGKTFTVSVARFGETYTTQAFDAIDLPDEVYVGIYLCSHNDAVVEKAVFRNVRLIRPAKTDFRPYHDYIGSDIELLDVATGTRKSILGAEDSLQAPNWTPDRRRLIYNHNGRIYSLDLATRATAIIDTGAQIHNNNDHALSFDGKRLGISSGPTSMVYTVPIGGGAPTQITPTGPSYLHGWSPDGKFLVFTGGRKGAFDIYRVPAAGGPEVPLTSHSGLNDGSEYTPDGKSIFFISNRTGKMQIWRMNADGSEQTQMTDDAYNNWFPHVSPDGKTVAFISFPPETRSDDHPFYRRVYLRKMPIGGGQPTVIAYVYGGQGSINVNSWSPDNATLAFVSNSGAF